jgi:hypothetical protein
MPSVFAAVTGLALCSSESIQGLRFFSLTLPSRCHLNADFNFLRNIGALSLFCSLQHHLRLSHGVRFKRSDYESTLSNGAYQLADGPRNIDRSPEDSYSQRRETHDGGDMGSLAYRQSPGAAYSTSASLVSESVDVCSAFVCQRLTSKLRRDSET